jgi:hypothetical protein
MSLLRQADHGLLLQHTTDSNISNEIWFSLSRTPKDGKNYYFTSASGVMDLMQLDYRIAN